VRILSEAQSNMRDDLDGAALWESMVTTRRPSLEELGAHLRHFPAAGGRQEMAWPGLRLALENSESGARMRCFWTRTLEELVVELPEQVEFTAHSRHKAELGFQVSKEHERELLALSCQLARAMSPLLANFTEGQRQPQELLALQIPGMVWNWLFEGDELPRDIQAYLTGWFAANAGVRQLLERLVEAHGTGMALTLPEHAHSLVELITRTRRLGFSIYWWEVQNMVMAAPNRGVHVELCQLLNLAVPEA